MNPRKMTYTLRYMSSVLSLQLISCVIHPNLDPEDVNLYLKSKISMNQDYLKSNTQISSSLLEKGSCNFMEWKVQTERNIAVNEVS